MMQALLSLWRINFESGDWGNGKTFGPNVGGDYKLPFFHPCLNSYDISL